LAKMYRRCGSRPMWPTSVPTTRPTIAGRAVIVFLVWLSNTAILLGAELSAELERGRAIAAGHPPDAEPYIALRDTRKIHERDNL
jgi:membrane protein